MKSFNFDILYQFSDIFYRLAFSILKNEDDANDCVQDLYMKFLNEKINIDEILNIKTFSLKIIRNLCLDRIKLKKNYCEISEIMNIASENQAEIIENQDIVELIRQKMKDLPEMQQTAVRLRDIEDFELAEIAEIMNINEVAVRVNLSRGRKFLREWLLMINK